MNDKVAVVVGGGSGMGAAVARRLAGDGYRIAVLSSSGKGEKLARDLGGIGMAGSNRSSDDLQALMDEVLQRWGRIDALVNSAGHGPKSPVLDLSDAQWFEGMEVYLLNVIRAARLVAPVMVRQGRFGGQHLLGLGGGAQRDVPHLGGVSLGSGCLHQAVC